jgi:mono/diheme cytochrome c family protein
MASRFNRLGQHARRSRIFVASLGVSVVVFAFADWISVSAQQAPAQPAAPSRTVKDGVYTAAQAQRGQAIFKDKCVPCHGASLGGDVGPSLTGDDFNSDWNYLPVSDLVNKIRTTMPQNAPGTLSREQATDLVSYILQVDKFPAGRAELSSSEEALKTIGWPMETEVRMVTVDAAGALTSRPVGTLAQFMRGTMFPNSNIIFNVQTQDPGAPKPAYEQGKAQFSWADWGQGIYTGWEVVDNAAIAIADGAPRLLIPRRCENGRQAPVNRADWIQWAGELTDAARAVYRAAQTRNQEAVIDAGNNLSDACLHCHEVYREHPGGTPLDPGNKAGRCTPAHGS